MSVIINQSGVAVAEVKVMKTTTYSVYVEVKGVRKQMFMAVGDRIDEVTQDVWEKIKQADILHLVTYEQALLLGAMMRGEVK